MRFMVTVVGKVFGIVFEMFLGKYTRIFVGRFLNIIPGILLGRVFREVFGIVVKDGF